MRKSKRLLSLSLYKEGLRQLLPVGLLFGILGVGLSSAQIVAGITGHGGAKLVLRDLTPSALTMFFFVAALAFISVLYLFNFLNKRGSVDFYHALPASRLTLYLSFAASILTWVWGVGIAALSLIVAVALIGGVPLTLGMVLMSYGLLLSASLFVVGAALVAVSITGTWFSSAVVTGLIVFTPYLVMKSFMQAVLSRVPGIPIEFADTIGGVSLHNTFFLLLVQRSVGVSHYAAASFIASIVVTFIWSFILVAAGAWLFRRRKSEMAGGSAPSKSFQLAYRVALSIFVVTFIMSTFITLGTQAISFDGLAASASLSSSLSALVVPLVVSLLVFLAFELITTRKPSRLLRALPSFGLVLAFIAAFFGAVALYTAYEKRAIPAATSQITSVRIMSSNYTFNSGAPRGYDTLFLGGIAPQANSYNQLLTQNITVKNPAVLRATANKLQELFRVQDSNDNTTTMLIEVRTRAGRTLYRVITVTLDTHSDAFWRAMVDTPEVKEALLALPKPDVQTTFESSAFMLSSSSGLPKPLQTSYDEQQRAFRKLYDIFYNEYQKLSPEEQYQFTNALVGAGSSAASKETTTIADFTRGGDIQIDGKLGNRPYENFYAFTSPEASTYQWKLTGRSVAGILDESPSCVHIDGIDLYTPAALRGMQWGASGSAVAAPFWSVESQWFVFSGQQDDTASSAVQTISNAKMQQAAAIIHPALLRDFDLNAPVYAQVFVGVYDTKGSLHTHAPLIVPLTAQEAAALRGLTK
ncbi:MAG: hypothetical protein FWD65_03420 [Coriobacteriia bacterium]|nr:hypothetical protein [Coriobacteriia bacterium]